MDVCGHAHVPLVENALELGSQEENECYLHAHISSWTSSVMFHAEKDAALRFVQPLFLWPLAAKNTNLASVF
jgi:hypothetical protein